MNNEKYSNIELSILLFILLNSFTSSLIINSFKSFTTIEIIISLTLSLIVGIPLIIQCNKVYSDSFIDNILRKKILKYLIIPILIVSVIIISIFSIYNSSIIIKNVLLRDMSLKIVIFSLIAVSSFLAYKGLKSITIASNLLFIIYIIITIVSFLFNFTNINSINLLPLNFKIEKLNIIKVIIYSNAPIFLMLLIPKKEIENFKNYKSRSLKTYLIFYIYLIIKILFILSILGNKYYSIIDYPEISVLKTISIFNFFERLEEILIINIYIENLIIISITIYYLSILLNKIFKKYTITIIATLLFIITINIEELDNNILIVSNSIFIILNMFLYKKRYH